MEITPTISSYPPSETRIRNCFYIGDNAVQHPLAHHCLTVSRTNVFARLLPMEKIPRGLPFARAGKKGCLQTSCWTRQSAMKDRQVALLPRLGPTTSPRTPWEYLAAWQHKTCRASASAFRWGIDPCEVILKYKRSNNTIISRSYPSVETTVIAKQSSEIIGGYKHEIQVTFHWQPRMYRDLDRLHVIFNGWWT